jgi:hypothetical protein
MGGTLEGGRKARETNLAKNPDFYTMLGTAGGKGGTGHTFAHGKVNPKLASSKGLKSRWGKKVEN